MWPHVHENVKLGFIALVVTLLQIWEYNWISRARFGILF